MQQQTGFTLVAGHLCQLSSTAGIVFLYSGPYYTRWLDQGIRDKSAQAATHR